MSLSKRKFDAVENGQELTPELVDKWLQDDLAKAAYVIHVIRTDGKIRKVMADHFLEQSKKVLDAKKDQTDLFQKDMVKAD